MRGLAIGLRPVRRLMVATALLAAGAVTWLAPGGARAASGPALAWSAPVSLETAPFATGIALASVACPSATLCVAGDGQSDIFTSTDPGDPAPKWQQAVIGSKAASQQTQIQKILCPVVSFCLAVGTKQAGFTALTSTDPAGGASAWVPSPKVHPFEAISCASAHLCAASGKGQITVSTNPAAGTSAVWNATAVDGTANITGIACPTTSFCAAVDDAGNVLTSADPVGGASTWRITNVNVSIGFESLTCPSTAFCAASDSLGRLVYSTDPADGTSATWHRTTTPVDADCLSASFCVGIGLDNPVVFTTNNPVGGSSAWQSSDIDGTSAVNAVSCVSPALCVAVDSSGNTVTSANPTGGSSTWNAQNIDGSTAILSMDCPTVSLCLAGDDAGNILTSTDPAGGSSAWSAAKVDGQPDAIVAISCAGVSLCVAAGGAGNIFTSTDPTGGPSAWSETTVDKAPGGEILSVACPAATLCVAGDDLGNVLSSTDPTGGASAWNVTSIRSDVFSSVDVGCATTALCLAAATSVHSPPTIFTSTDQQGGSWQESAQFPDANFIGSVACPATSLCVADGTINVGDNETPVIFSATQPTGGIAAWNILQAGPGRGSLSCPTTTFCVAAGGSARGVFVSTDPAGTNSADWVPSAGAVANAVSCPTASFCVGGTEVGQIQIGVPPVPTVTSITSVTAGPVAGQPVTVKVKVAATQGTAAPTGTVTVSDGTRTCTATLAGSSGAAAGQCSITEAVAGRYALSASYPAQGAFGASGTTSSAVFTVGKAASAVTLSLSARQVTFGREQQAKLSVRVRPQFAGVPTGQVVISAGTVRVCALTLRAAAGSCRLGATRLMAGRYTLTARYGGSGSFRPSATTARLVVHRARSATRLKLSARRLKFGHEQAERLSVTVRPQFAGVPAGTVVVTGRRGTVCTLVLRAGKASGSLRRKQLRPGTYHLVATYHGSRDFTRSTAAATLTVSS